MRGYAWITLFVLALVAPFVTRQFIGGPSNSPDTDRPGSRKLVIITPHNQDIRREFARAFGAWHLKRHGQPVEIDFRVPGGANDIKRQLADTYRSWREPDGSLDPRFVPDIHIAWGGGDYFFNNELKPLGILQPMRLDLALLAAAFPEPALAGVALYERTTDASGAPTPQWVGVCLSAFGIVYNPDVYLGLGLSPPSQWHDLTDPRLAGHLSLADPTHSGSAASAYMVVVQRRMADAERELFEQRPELPALPATERAKDPAYRDAIAAGWKRGMSELLLIAANGRYFTDSAPQVANDVGNGDAAAGISIDFYGRVYEQVVGSERCRIVTPAGATAITPDPVAILAGVRGEALELASRFVEFLLTPEGQRLWILRPGAPGGPVERALRRPPVRRDVYPDRAGWTDDVNPFTESRGFNQRPDFMSYYTDTRPVWTAAWIDGRESLKSAYHAVLGVADTQRRDALLAELADLPITLDEVARHREQRKAQEQPGGNAEEWKARRRIDLARRFRAHYAAVQRKAR
jgi:ABC-type Fe3+ transport system substrate-binding protein